MPNYESNLDHTHISCVNICELSKERKAVWFKLLNRALSFSFDFIIKGFRVGLWLCFSRFISSLKSDQPTDIPSNKMLPSARVF
jgi:hypothetical protein